MYGIQTGFSEITFPSSGCLLLKRSGQPMTLVLPGLSNILHRDTKGENCVDLGMGNFLVDMVF